MKSIKRIFKITGIAIIALILACTIYIGMSGPSLPKQTNEIIDNVLASPLPEIINGETGFAKANDINIWYESISPKGLSKGAVLLIMGISNDALGWPQNFIKALVDSGYQVIRYDHRGTGMSDWLENWSNDNVWKNIWKNINRNDWLENWSNDNPYSLADMANDGVAVLDALNIQKANIIGISMGGMIAQELAINHPDRIASLTSMMSSGFIEDPELPKISTDVTYELIKVSLKYGIIGGEKNMIKLHLASRIILMGNANYKLNIKELSEQVLYNIRKRKGYNSNVSKQHQSAVFLSGSRYNKLKNISVPTLIIHGKSDPFIPIEHGKKCVSIIPNADSLWINNLGHDIPDIFIDTISKRIITNFR